MSSVVVARALALSLFVHLACTATGGRDAPDAPSRASSPPAPVTAPEAPSPPAPPTPIATAPATSEPAPAVASEPSADLLARLARWRPDLESACAAQPRLACTRTGDIDGDGHPDDVALVRRRGSEKLGLAILWARGGGYVLGAGERGHTWLETVDSSPRTVAIPDDLSWLARWDVWPADGPAGERTGVRDAKGQRRFALPGVVGDGLLLDGGDSAAVAYRDGQRWRLGYLGF